MPWSNIKACDKGGTVPVLEYSPGKFHASVFPCAKSYAGVVVAGVATGPV